MVIETVVEEEEVEEGAILIIPEKLDTPIVYATFLGSGQGELAAALPWRRSFPHMSTSHQQHTALHRDRPCNAIHRGHRTATPPSAISWRRPLLPYRACSQHLAHLNHSKPIHSLASWCVRRTRAPAAPRISTRCASDSCRGSHTNRVNSAANNKKLLPHCDENRPRCNNARNAAANYTGTFCVHYGPIRPGPSEVVKTILALKR
ncbi:hypothetical protein TcasGA2_TC008548 [Tribolium castaneum]|uniref:Uncharacterized protein n=1 Tax=Tribolium castaneum TaxID=7070 RepID=D7EI82_TRICA|nr:hypothetical protein TcasGA2_TC008548 [Tribolium castaneum]